MTSPMRADNNVIKNNFSKHAGLYDEYAGIQYLAAQELIKRSPVRSIRKILDIGCGTGSYTLLLREKFKLADITAVDISRDMVDTAREKPGTDGIDFIVADAEELSLSGGFDLITSNAAFQWFSDLDSSLAKYEKALTEEGSILFSTFGPLTFCELSSSIKAALGGDTRISSGGFQWKEELAGAMKAHFGQSTVDETVIKKVYASLDELLRHIKYTGARGDRISRIPLWTRTMLKKVEEAYIEEFGRIEASYHIFYCEGSR